MRLRGVNLGDCNCSRTSTPMLRGVDPTTQSLALFIGGLFVVVLGAGILASRVR